MGAVGLDRDSMVDDGFGVVVGEADLGGGLVGGGAAQVIQTQVPITGPDAIVSNSWYHVAVSYNGIASTAGDVKIYWTLLDPSRTVANRLALHHKKP